MQETYPHYDYPDVPCDFVAEHDEPDEDPDEWEDEEDEEEDIDSIPLGEEMFECAVCGKDRSFEELGVKVCAGEFICLDCHCQAVDYSIKEVYA